VIRFFIEALTSLAFSRKCSTWNMSVPCASFLSRPLKGLASISPNNKPGNFWIICLSC
jgi:hypothetical protein